MLGQRLLSSLLVLYLIGLAVNAFTQTSVPDKSKQLVTEAAPGAEQEIAPAKTEKIDEVGEKVGDSIDSMGETASSYFGQWIDSPAIAGISWLKLLFCFFFGTFGRFY